MIADHPSDTMEDEFTVYQYKFDTSAFHNPKFLLNSEADRNRFKAEVDSTLDAMVKEKKIAEADKHAIRDILRMTIPEKVMNHGKEYPWIFGQFDHAPIVAASVMTSVGSDVLQVQNLASTHIKSRVKSKTSTSIKLTHWHSPLRLILTKVILGLKVMICI